MGRLEQAFDDAERAAVSTMNSAKSLTRLATQMQKAAKTGNVATIKRAQRGLGYALTELAQEVKNAVESWPFEQEEEERYLRDDYAGELIDAAEEKGLGIFRGDTGLIAHPSVVQILPDKRAVRIDSRQNSSIRPSHLAEVLLANQAKRSRFRSGAPFRPDTFLESLYKVYSDIVHDESTSRLVRVGGRVVRLERVYKLLTALPGDSREYGRTDFARDLYNLEVNGPKRARNGAAVSFPASTGTKGSRGVFAFIGPDGQRINYYGLKFTEPDPG